MKRILALIAALAALLVTGIPVAAAAVIEIPINTVVRADVGSTTVLATRDTPSDLVGENCLVVAQAKNQSSVHPGNDLIVASGGDSITLADVERAGGVLTEASDYLTLGATITVSLRMGRDGVFSGGLTISAECPPPTTTTTAGPTTTTTVATSTTVSATPPVIVIDKSADAEFYEQDGIGYFTITVTNPGPVDLIDVHVTDDVALGIDPGSDCPNPDVPDLAVGESYSYQCAVSNLNGVSPFTNEATATGTAPDGTKATDTDDATVFPPVLATTLTAPQPTTPAGSVPPTLPNTGVPFEQVRGLSIVAFLLVLAGAALLGIAALIGRQRQLQVVRHHEVWLDVQPKPRTRVVYIPIRRKQ